MEHSYCNSILTSLQSGINMLEASAGTGKTKTIIEIYLQLILGLNIKNINKKSLNVKNILVVTFTRSATEELRNRIKIGIHELKLYYINKVNCSSSPLELKNINLIIKKLLIAEQQINEAAIFTIHSFCKRMLINNAIESEMLFQQNLIEDESILYQEAVYDFWRKHFYKLPLEVINILHNCWNSPKKLLLELLPYLQNSSLKIFGSFSNKNFTIVTYHVHIITYINKLKQLWNKIENKLLKIFNKFNLNKRIYNKKNLTFWIKKINFWAKQPTVDYIIPKEIERFKNSILLKQSLDNNISHNYLFELIEEYYDNVPSLKEFILFIAIKEIRKNILWQKQKKFRIGFDDLLHYFDNFLHKKKGNKLINLIHSYYPVAIIDEFQDTDLQQSRIFYKIYYAQPNCYLLLIGDPKQSIYTFRGANIFNYINIRNLSVKHRTLNINWRSSKNLVNATNNLFQCLPNPFFFTKIPFLPLKFSKNNINMKLIINNKIRPAMQICLYSDSIVGTDEYQKIMAKNCAMHIRNLLHAAQNNNAWLKNQDNKKPLQASDITILVRNNNEAELIHNTLILLKIPTVYFSNKKNVFATIEACELQWLLEAILKPYQENILRRALVTNFIGLNTLEIDTLNKEENKWELWIKIFNDYYLFWQKYGISSLIKKIIFQNKKNSTFTDINNRQNLVNILHLSELLQEASIYLDNEHALLHWLISKINKIDENLSNQYVRSDNDDNAVKIITIHKSKGLEFPLVFLPFVASFRKQKYALFHDRKKHQMYLDLNIKSKNFNLSEKERLAEDMRLLYVAITRSIFYCDVGIAPLVIYKKRDKKNESDLHMSALGYLIQQGKSGDINFLKNQIEKLILRSSNDIRLFNINKNIISNPLSELPDINNQYLSARIFHGIKYDNWQIASYTSIQRKISNLPIETQFKLDLEVIEENNLQKTQTLTSHTFPRGMSSGTFLHILLEKLDFSEPISQEWLYIQLKQNNIDLIWLPTIQIWLTNIANVSLNNERLTLSQISLENKCTEMNFCFPINNILSAYDLDSLFKTYDPISAICPVLNFPKFKGMLKGFIDLVFFWNGCYYLLDYKSNWLGKNNDFYSKKKMKQAIVANRYELQYQLYSLALHRFLKYKIFNYDYNINFGGVFYLFLRGINNIKTRNGIYFCKPNIKLIFALDRLFS